MCTLQNIRELRVSVKKMIGSKWDYAKPWSPQLAIAYGPVWEPNLKFKGGKTLSTPFSPDSPRSEAEREDFHHFTFFAPLIFDRLCV